MTVTVLVLWIKRATTILCWVAGVVLIGLSLGFEPRWLVELWSGLVLLCVGGLRPLWTIMVDGIASNPPADWFTDDAANVDADDESKVTRG